MTSFIVLLVIVLPILGASLEKHHGWWTWVEEHTILKLCK